MEPRNRLICVMLLVAIGVSLSRPSAAAAECSYLPPYPPITAAIPTARDIVVGTVIDGNPAARLQVTEVLRGDHKVGELLDLDIAPNWPWTKITTEAAAFPSCSHLFAAVDEVIALATDARQPAQTMQAFGVTWNQPPTLYNAMGVIREKPQIPDLGIERERVSLKQLRELASMPATDSSSLPSTPGASDSWPLAVLAGMLATLVGLRRFRPRDLARR